MRTIDRPIDITPPKAAFSRAHELLIRLALGAAVVFVLQITVGLVHG